MQLKLRSSLEIEDSDDDIFIHDKLKTTKIKAPNKLPLRELRTNQKQNGGGLTRAKEIIAIATVVLMIVMLIASVIFRPIFMH